MEYTWLSSFISPETLMFLYLDNFVYSGLPIVRRCGSESNSLTIDRSVRAHSVRE